MTPRSEVIDALSDAASDGMAVAAKETKATVAEVLSGCLTFANRAITVVINGSEGVQQAENRSVILDALVKMVKDAEGTVS